MKNRVYNGTVGKIFRTLGFLLVLAASVFMGAGIITNPDYASISGISNLTSVANQILGVLNETAYAFASLTLGLIFLVFAIRKGVVVKVLLTVLLVVAYVASLADESLVGVYSYYAPVLRTALPSFLSFLDPAVFDLLEQGLNLSEYVLPALYAVVAFLAWVVFAYKKPKRISVTFLRVGALLLFFAVLVTGIKEVLAPNLLTQTFAQTAYVYGYLLAYAFFAVGSVFGVIGFARK